VEASAFSARTRIHFRTADVQGAALGKKVAHYLHKHYFQSVE